MKKILLLTIFFLISIFLVTTPAVAIVGVSCQSLSISPQKTAYAPAKRNIIQQPYISTEILGTYNASSKTWTSNWTVPGDGLTAGVTPCTGCHKTIAVDSSYGAKAGDISWLDWMYFPCVLLKTNLKDIYIR